MWLFLCLVVYQTLQTWRVRMIINGEVYSHTHTLTEFNVCVLCVFQWRRARRRQHAEVIRRSAGCSGLRDSLHGRTSHPVRQHGFNEFWTMIKHQHTGFWVVEFKSLRFWKHFTFHFVCYIWTKVDSLEHFRGLNIRTAASDTEMSSHITFIQRLPGGPRASGWESRHSDSLKLSSLSVIIDWHLSDILFTWWCPDETFDMI